ncbi:MAG: hypothetical protein KDD94_07415 [Calditrichaeota bacterium]|nr:hypothetical protein [Calditrichota bacterium]
MSFLDRLFGNSKSFYPPDGLNFKSPEMELNDLYHLTSDIFDFISNDYDDRSFWLFDDWWEFDGTHFPRKKIILDELKVILTDSKQLFDSRRNDFLVYTGIAPVSFKWYLRYNVENANSAKPICSLDMTVPYIDAERFKELVLDKNPQLNFHQADGKEYYQSIIKEAQSQ